MVITIKTAVQASVAALALGLAGCDNQQHQAQSPAPTKQTDAPTAAAERPPATVPLAAGIISQTAQWGTEGKDNIDPAGMLADNWYAIFDGSGSMADGTCSSGKKGGRIVDARDAMISFERRIPANANLGLFVFDTYSREEKVKLGNGPTNRGDFEKAIRRTSAGSDTPLGLSLKTAMDALAAQASKQGGYGTYHIVVATDGLPNGKEGEDALVRAVDEIVKTPIVLETIGFCIDGGHPLNRPGQTIYHNAMNPADLNKSLEEILAETDAFTDDLNGTKP